MDELADRAGHGPGRDPAAQRAWSEGDLNITGQVIDSRGAGRRAAAAVSGPCRCRPSADGGRPTCGTLPGGVSNTTHGEGVVRGVGYAVGLQERRLLRGLRRLLDRPGPAGDDRRRGRSRPCTPRRRRSARALITVEQQICRTELGVERVVVHPKDTAVGSGGSTSASRQTYVTGGAVKAACEAVRAAGAGAGRAAARPAGRRPAAGRRQGRRPTPARCSPALADVLGDDAVEETVEWRHRPTARDRPGDRPGRRARAVRLLRAPGGRRRRRRARAWSRWSRWTCAQDVGKAINPRRRRRPDPGRHRRRAWAWR